MRPGGDLAAQLRRERLLDMETRIGVFRRRAFVVLALALVASTIADRLVRTRTHAHRWAAAGWCISGVMIAGSIALTGVAGSPAVMWMALPAVTLGARFELRGVLYGVAYLIALMFLSTVAFDPQAVIDRPDTL